MPLRDGLAMASRQLRVNANAYRRSRGISFSRSRPNSFILAAYVLGKVPIQVQRFSEGRRRSLDYREAQFLEGLFLCRSLRPIGDELYPGFAGSLRISV